MPDSESIFTSPQLEAATAAARQGAEVLRRYFRGEFPVQQKHAGNLVSRADFESEEAITRTISRTFPDHEILGEETGQAVSGQEDLWVIDPLDGTNNFVHGIEHFAISIAWYHRGQAELGVVVRPASDDWFVAGRGQGAWRNGRPVRVSTATTLDQVLLGVGFYYDRGRKMQATLQAMQDLFQCDIHGFRRMGTASLDLCMVGCGQLGAYFEFQLAPWDFAAGRLFVEEAGGRVTDCDGHQVPLRPSSILASNGHLHDELLQRIAPCWGPLRSRCPDGSVPLPATTGPLAQFGPTGFAVRDK